MQLPYPVRVLGLDLGITSAHRGVVVDGEGQVRARRSAAPTVDSLSVLEAAALQGAEPGTRLLVVVEPTGPAWLPIAVFFGRRGHLVVRVSSAKAADLRRFLSRHAKTNGIDAETLARLPLVAPESLEPVELPGAARATLDRRVRAVARLTARIGEHKTRIRALAAALMPTIGAALGSSLTRADLAVLARWGDPRALRAVSLRRLSATIDKASLGHSGEEKALAFHVAAAQALALWDGDSAVALADVAAELATEIRLLHAAEIERAEHEAVRDAAMATVDPDGLAASVPGLGPVGTSVLTAAMGRPGRFPNAAAFKQFTGLAPRTNQTGDTNRKSQPMSKAGPRGLRSALIHCADTARRQDPQLAAIYHAQMTTRNATHLKALCVVAARLAERAWVTLADGQPYQLRDVDGTPVTAAQAKQIIADRYTVPPELRRRRRSGRQKGKIPQQPSTGGKSRPTAGHEATFPSPTVPHRRPPVKQPS